MQEDLLGYLLGALEPEEMQRVEQWLREDAAARQELADLERILERLEEADELAGEIAGDPLNWVDDADVTPPADLISRTLANLPPLPLPTDAGAEQQGAEQQGEMTDGSDEQTYGEQAAREQPLYGDLSLSSASEGGVAGAWRWQDWSASVVAVAVLIAIVIPTLVEGRFAARKAACQDHLRELGVAMTQFASRNAQSRLPSVAPAGYQAFAGVYALRLRDAGLLNDPGQTLCPSIQPGEFLPEGASPSAAASMETHWVSGPELSPESMMVSLQTLDAIGRELTLAGETVVRDAETTKRVMHAIEKLRHIQMTAGGHYAYTLGVREGDHFSSPRFEGRSQFAVMSDAAMTRVPVIGTTPSQSGFQWQVLSHGGRGINVLYEDGHVGFLPSQALDRMPDNPLINHEGLSEAGVTLDDASLAPSWQPPFMRASQR